MDLLEFVRANEAPVIVVDDRLAPPVLTPVPERVKRAWQSELKSDESSAEQLAALLRLPQDTPVKTLVAASVEKIGELWPLYDGKADEYVYLAALFEHVADHSSQAERPRKLIEAITAAIGRKPLVFTSMEEAADSLSTCALAFVDLYVSPDKLNLDTIIDIHRGYREQYRSTFLAADDAWPKLIVLMSSNLPPESDLRRFREYTGVRSAFFRGVNKRDFADGLTTVESLLEEWSSKYEQSARMNRYLESISASVKQSCQGVIGGIERLEIHDLAVLDAARLIADGTNLHSYLAWLVSELLASKARNEFARQEASAPERASSGAIDPRLVNNSVLFDMFADIAVSPPKTAGIPEFGEVFAAVGEMWTQPFNVYVALSPACDLARCDTDFEVLLLQGRLEPSGRQTNVLLEQSASYGKGVNLLTYVMDGQQHLGRVKWDKKRALTRPAGDLANDSKYVRLTRLSELFAHEIKDFALSNLSRIGLPVAPTVQKIGSVEVRVKFNLGQGQPPLEMCQSAPTGPDVSALIARGRNAVGGDEENLIMLTASFRAWLFNILEPLLNPHLDVPKVRNLLENLKAWDQWTVAEKSGKVREIPDFVVKRGQFSGNCGTGLEIWVDHQTQ